jgi:hypothetical protein
MTPEVYDLLEQMRTELGSWRVVAWKGNIKLRVLRNIRQGKRKAITLKVLDRMITGTGVGNLGQFTFFTAEDLVRLGIWSEPTYLDGDHKVIGGERVPIERPQVSRLERERIGRRKQRKRRKKVLKQRAMDELYERVVNSGENPWQLEDFDAGKDSN